MYWANFLHFYQPPTQKEFWVRKITQESYRPIILGLLKYPRAKITLNVSGTLIEQFDKYGETDIIEAIKKLLENNQIELTGSAKYHTLLPFLPKDEVIRQIQLNEETLKKYFGSLWQKKGFFPPEMGFSKEIAEIVKELGYQWIIADEYSFEQNKLPIDYSKIYQINGLDNFYIFFRERKTSWLILSGQLGTGKLLVESLGKRLEENNYLLTAMDGETFGHHRPGLENLLWEIYSHEKIRPVLISDLPTLFPNKETVNPKPSTWALMAKDLEKNKPFSRWDDKDNKIHQMQWELTNLALSSIKLADQKMADYSIARSMLDQALHSDQYWWASARPWWSIEMIERGAKELLESILKMPNIPQANKEKAAELYKNIIFTAFDWQREGIVDELANKEDEEIRQRTDAQMPRLPKDEIDKMVAKLNEELKSVVNNQEFERAAQIRDRIKELQKYIA